MTKQKLITTFAAAITLSLAAAALLPVTASAQEVYGSQLMTQQERLEHRQRMQNAGTAEERERLRADHHAKMQARATERGVTLPEMPPARGMGQGMGQGMGKGQGQGMGQRGQRR